MRSPPGAGLMRSEQVMMRGSALGTVSIHAPSNTGGLLQLV